jgi:hypothetical protein
MFSAESQQETRQPGRMEKTLTLENASKRNIDQRIILAGSSFIQVVHASLNNGAAEPGKGNHVTDSWKQTKMWA